MLSAIEIIPSHKIDKVKWDACINRADNGLIYAYTFYLDMMAKHWDGLVLTDYEAVMPLIWNKKFGIYYLYQPHFTPVCGIFGNNISIELTNQFLKTIPKRFQYWDFDINNYFASNNFSNEIKLSKRVNQIISLSATENKILSSYKRLAKRMLQKSKEQNLLVRENVEATAVIDFYKKNYYPHKHADVHPEDYERLKKVIEIANKKGHVQTFEAISSSGNTEAVYLVLSDSRYVYSLLGGSTEEGKKCGAFYLLTHTVIIKNCGTKRIFRFEGSDREGIALFNHQFGATPTYYYHLKRNKILWPFKYLKQ
jgi:hypothetical protein